MLAGGNRTGLIMASGNGLESMELVPKEDFSDSAPVKIARRTVSRPNASVANCRVCVAEIEQQAGSGYVRSHSYKRWCLCLYSAVETL